VCRAQDKDSLIARLVQARFTGMFRFSWSVASSNPAPCPIADCRAAPGVVRSKAFLEWMDSEGVAAAGANAPEGARANNPADYGSPYDRNILVIASVLAAESHLEETETVMHPSVFDFWEDNCVVILAIRTPHNYRAATLLLVVGSNRTCTARRCPTPPSRRTPRCTA